MDDDAQLDLKSHASRDPCSRNCKDSRVEPLLGLIGGLHSGCMLNAGFSSGDLTRYLSRHLKRWCDVNTAQMQRNFLVAEGYRYTSGRRTKLPFPDETFEAAFTNPIFEQVGDEHKQRTNRVELYVVLRPQDVGDLSASAQCTDVDGWCSADAKTEPMTPNPLLDSIRQITSTLIYKSSHALQTTQARTRKS